MNVTDLIVALVFSALAGFSVMDARAAWRDQRRRPPARPGRGAGYYIAVRVVILTSVAVLMAAATAASATQGQAATTINAAGGALAVVGILAGGTAALTLRLWRWPGFLVPPPLRTGPDGAGSLSYLSPGPAAPPVAVVPSALTAASGRAAGEASAGYAQAAEVMFTSRPVDPAVLAAAEGNGAAVLALARAAGGWRDRARAYQVVVDEEPVARIRHGGRLDLPLAAGQHRVYVKIDWCQSQVIDVAARPGEVVRLYCAPGGSARTALNQSLAGGYIDLIRV